MIYHARHQHCHVPGKLNGYQRRSRTGARGTIAELPRSWPLRSEESENLLDLVAMRSTQSWQTAQGCSTLSIEFPVEERIGSGESGSISILTEC